MSDFRTLVLLLFVIALYSWCVLAFPLVAAGLWLLLGTGVIWDTRETKNFFLMVFILLVAVIIVALPELGVVFWIAIGSGAVGNLIKKKGK